MAEYVVLIFAAIAVIIVAKLLAWPVKKILKLALNVVFGVILIVLVNTFGGAIANILNMSDGLLSDIFNIKFICTFNADINKVDPALLRKGRCYANYEFKELSEDKVRKLNEKYKLDLSEIKAMTLADIYNANTSDKYSENKTHKKIGF